MLQLAVPNKGALSEDAIELLRSCNYKCMRYGRELANGQRYYLQNRQR